MDPVTNASAEASGVFSGAESRPPPGNIRSACNRCHSQKLRCVRNVGQVSCERCLKLKRPCRFGLRAPRASLKAPEQATGRAHGNWRKPLPMSSSILTPSIQSYPMIAGTTESDWLGLLSAGTGTAEGRGWSCLSCLKWNLFKITCFS